MSLYRCDECGCVENTACGFYWSRNNRSIWDRKWIGRKLCSEHGPQWYRSGEATEFGKWHDRFPQRPAEGMLVDDDGCLWRTKEQVPAHYHIVGVMQADGSIAPNPAAEG